MGAIDDGERTTSEGGVHFADIFSRGFFAFDDDGRRRRSEASEEIEDSGAGFFDLGAVGIEGEGEIDDGDMNRVGLDDALGGISRRCDMGFDTHWVEDHGEPINPWSILPARIGEQEVESAAGCEGGSA